MRFALLSDIHANLHALHACLAHARARQVDRFIFLGDLVGYGGDPSPVVEHVMQMALNEGAIVLLGNHDVLALRPPRTVTTMGDYTASWTNAQLSPEHLDWLGSLPLTCQIGSSLFVHASAHAPYEWHYVYERPIAHTSLLATEDWQGVRYVFCGHTHVQTLFCQTGERNAARTQVARVVTDTPLLLAAQKKWHASIGSVGQPRDGNPHAMYAVLELPDLDKDAPSNITFFRIPYDYSAAADTIRRVGLFDFFADRLEEGR